VPVWLQTWWHSFGRGDALYLFSVRHAGRTIGIAPLQRNEHTVRLIGDENVCDHLDFVVTPEASAQFYRILLESLKKDGIKRLDLSLVRQDSSVMTQLLPVAEKAGYNISCEGQDILYELPLPGSWDEYLSILGGKERHEIRRKLRRLNEAGRMNYRLVDDALVINQEMETFLKLFRSNRSDKAEFMNGRMAAFFKELAESLNTVGILKLFFLELDQRPVAGILCFNYHSTMYLYNNGYDNHFNSLSVGFLGKLLSIKESIQSGIKTYDFLKGAEVYKKRLGGQPVQLYRCRIDFT
jgi:CelD/BcsL family acetyltransferase involved in cellulose biosynthesis